MNRQEYIQRLADSDEYRIGDKTFIYRKVTNKQFNDLEAKKLSLRKERDVELGSKLIDDIMRFSAKLFFNIESEYDDLPREELNDAIEAATYRSLYGKPFLGLNSPTFSDSAAKSPEQAAKQ